MQEGARYLREDAARLQSTCAFVLCEVVEVDIGLIWKVSRLIACKVVTALAGVVVCESECWCRVMDEKDNERFLVILRRGMRARRGALIPVLCGVCASSSRACLACLPPRAKPQAR